MADQVAEQLAGQVPGEPAAGRVPTVVVDGVHIIYRVHGAGPADQPAAAEQPPGQTGFTAWLNRLSGAGRSIGTGRLSGTGQLSDTGRLRRLRQIRADARPSGVREVHAVKGVSFAAYRGEAVGLVGANGSGKSTLLRAIAGLLPTERGAVYTAGQPSLLGVNAVLMNDLTGQKNVVLGGLAMGMSREQVRERYRQIVDFSGVNARQDFISMPMRTYSSGMAARLRFSIAAAKDHDVLLIDEALATGDRAFQQQSQRRIEQLRERAGTIFLVSHNHKSIREVCDRVIWLDSGRLRMDGPTEAVLAAYEAEVPGRPG